MKRWSEHKRGHVQGTTADSAQLVVALVVAGHERRASRIGLQDRALRSSVAERRRCEPSGKPLVSDAHCDSGAAKRAPRSNAPQVVVGDVLESRSGCIGARVGPSLYRVDARDGANEVSKEGMREACAFS